MQTKDENLKFSKQNLKTEVKLLEAGYCKFPLRSIIKINKRQSALHTDGSIVRWIVELLRYFRSQSEQFEATEAFLSKNSLLKNTAVLRASKKLMMTLDYRFQPRGWNPPRENPDLEDKLSMLPK